MYSVENTAPFTSAFKGKLEKNRWFHKVFMQFGEEWNLKSYVLKPFVRVHLPDVRTETRVFDGRPPCQIPAPDRG